LSCAGDADLKRGPALSRPGSREAVEAPHGAKRRLEGVDVLYIGERQT
jgi:hypothetical protein